MQLALPRPPADDEPGAPSALTGLLSHLDVVYRFTLTLTGAAEQAADLTEHVFQSVHDDLWSTLGGRGLRDRLLARAVAAFMEVTPSREAWKPHAAPHPPLERSGLAGLLHGLSWRERAAIALVDQLGLSYAAGATVLGVEDTEFRTTLHGGRAVLYAAYRAGAR